MTYTTNEMVLPRNFAKHSEDEMMYLDGGKTEWISYKTLAWYCGTAAAASEIIAVSCSRVPALFECAFWFGITGILLGVVTANLGNKSGGIRVDYGRKKYTVGRRTGYRLEASVSTYK